MKKKVFNQQTLADVSRPTGLYVRLFPKAGSISFSADLSKKLNLEKGGRTVLFVQDEDRPADWYIEVSDDPAGFTPRIKPKTAGAIIQNSALCREIITSAKLEMVSQRLLVGIEPIETNLYAIITKSAQMQLKKAS